MQIEYKMLPSWLGPKNLTSYAMTEQLRMWFGILDSLPYFRCLEEDAIASQNFT